MSSQKKNDQRSPFEKKIAEKKEKAAEQEEKDIQEEYIRARALKEWPTVKHLNQALRYLEVFAQLMKIKPFLAWMKKHIEIHDQVNHQEKTIDTFVVYKDETQEIHAHDIPDDAPPDQNLIRCPGCGVLFDANVRAPVIQLATSIPKDLTPPTKKE